MAFTKFTGANLVGGKELTDKFMKMSKIGEQRELTKSVRNIAVGLQKDIKTEIRTKLKKHTGKLEKSVVVKKDKTAKADFPSMVVHMDFSQAPHAYLVEYGHRITNVKGGPTLGFVPPHPFFRPVILREEKNIYDAVVDETIKIIKRMAANP